MTYFSGKRDLPEVYRKIADILQARMTQAEGLLSRLPAGTVDFETIAQLHDQLIDINNLWTDATSDYTAAEIRDYVRNREDDQALDVEALWFATQAAGQAVVVDCRALASAHGAYEAPGQLKFRPVTYTDLQTQSLQASLATFIATLN